MTFFAGENEIDWVSAEKMEVSIITTEFDKLSKEKVTFDNNSVEYTIEDRYFVCKRKGRDLKFDLKENLPKKTPHAIM